MINEGAGYAPVLAHSFVNPMLTIPRPRPVGWDWVGLASLATGNDQ